MPETQMSQAPTDSVFEILSSAIDTARICLNKLEDVEDRFYVTPKTVGGSNPPGDSATPRPSIEQLGKQLRKMTDQLSEGLSRIQNRL